MEMAGLTLTLTLTLTDVLCANHGLFHDCTTNGITRSAVQFFGVL